MASTRITRRSFLQTASAVGLAIAGAPSVVFSKSPNEKLDIACVGVGGRGGDDLGGVMSQNIVAIVDVDARTLAKAGERVQKANGKRPTPYKDFRVMLDKEHNNIDAIVVGTPDHMHGPIASAAMRLGKHAYVEKPLCHDVWECRLLASLAREHKLATQLGTQIHAEDNYRRVVELVQAGAIGNVSEAHVWVGKSWSDGRDPAAAQPVPDYLDWDLWTGVSPMHPFAPNVFHPANWRKFWDFGTGTLGDMGCHFIDVVYWALDLHLVFPDSVWADAADPPHPVGTPHALATHLTFPAHGSRSAMTLHWYDSGRKPEPVEQGHVIVNGKAEKWGSGVLFVGDKGMLLCDYGRRHLLPEEKFSGFTPPTPTIPRSIGHHNEWIKACKDGSPTTCNFTYSGQLSETVLLGNVAYRVGKKLEWDGANMKATNAPEAEQYIHRKYREGWSV
jgi:predicted dehydrogenase